MTTASWSTVLDHSSDAGFRAWGSELNTKFASVGLVQTADTGQINWTTVTRPGTSTLAGYEIWRLSGSALFFKIQYGTGTAAAAPRIDMTIGTGSNGSGTLTGQTNSTISVSKVSSTPGSTVTAYQSWLCATASFFGLAWKNTAAGAGSNMAYFGVGLTVDATGTPSNVGYYINSLNGNTTTARLQTVRTLATAQTRNSGSSYCVFPGNPTVSSDGVNNQVYLHWLDTPSVQPALYTATVVASELTAGNTVSLTLVGSTPHTYISAGFSTASTTFDANGTTSPPMTAIMLWE